MEMIHDIRYQEISSIFNQVDKFVTPFSVLSNVQTAVQQLRAINL